jgi:hypothetical protein
VAGAGDGQELGDAFDDAEDDGVQGFGHEGSRWGSGSVW